MSKHDLVELYGEFGAVQRVKFLAPGTAEVIFVKKRAAMKAAEIYHNVTLDGQPMKLHVVSDDRDNMKQIEATPIIQKYPPETKANRPEPFVAEADSRLVVRVTRRYIFPLFELLNIKCPSEVKFVGNMCSIVRPRKKTKNYFQVTNLPSSMTLDDIEELFGFIGIVKDIKLPMPGTAEVVFVNLTDAEKAITMYNNEKLDGKRLNCQVVSHG